MKVLVIGDAILDHYVYGHINRMSPEDPGTPVLDIEGEEYRLGGCLNVAANLKSLSDFDVHTSSIISDRCVKLLKSRDIRSGYCHRLHDLDGIKKTRVINSHSQKQIVRLDNIKKFGRDVLEEFRFLLTCVDFRTFDCIVISDYSKGIVGDFLIRKLRTYRKPVFVDTKNPDLAIWNGIENCVIKINTGEFLNKSSSPKCPLVVTHGERGCFLYEGQDVYNFPTNVVENADVTGAGDVFLAGLVTEYMKSKDLSKAINFAHKAAGKSVQGQGTCEVYL